MPTLLIVDNDPGLRHITSIFLMLSGKDVFCAGDGLEALAILAKEPIDLLVLDLAMPGMDGWETFREARRAGYEGPVLIMSGHNAHSAASELGADAALAKPFDPDDLIAKCESLLPAS